MRDHANILSALIPQRFDPPSSFSRKYSSSSSYFSLSYSTRCASSSPSIRVCSSSSALCLDSRARRTPYSTFNCARLCSSSFCIDYLIRCASFSALGWDCSSSSYFILDSSTRRAFSSVSSRTCYSSALRLASRDSRTPSYTFSRARLCSSTLVMRRDACVSWKLIFLWHSAN